jgi:hypothetical protein
MVPNILTQQIPIFTPVRERVVIMGDGEDDSRGRNGRCIPNGPATASFPWVVQVNNGERHSMNANRIR